MNRARKRVAAPRGRAYEIDVAALRNQFRRLRLARGVSQSAAASLLGVSQATISAFEHGVYGVRPDTLLALGALVTEWTKKGAYTDREQHDRIVVVHEDPANTCRGCGARLPLTAREVRFCPFCGDQQGQVCVCGAHIADSQARFCTACGRPVTPLPPEHRRPYSED